MIPYSVLAYTALTRPYRWVQCGEKGATIIEMTAAYKYTKASFDKRVKLDAKKNVKKQKCKPSNRINTEGKE